MSVREGGNETGWEGKRKHTGKTTDHRQGILPTIELGQAETYKCSDHRDSK